jgi:hypothetical protein
MNLLHRPPLLGVTSIPTMGADGGSTTGATDDVTMGTTLDVATSLTSSAVAGSWSGIPWLGIGLVILHY